MIIVKVFLFYQMQKSICSKLIINIMPVILQSEISIWQRNCFANKTPEYRKKYDN